MRNLKRKILASLFKRSGAALARMKRADLKRAEARMCEWYDRHKCCIKLPRGV